MPAHPIYWIADRLAPDLRRQFLAAVTKLQGRVTIGTLEAGMLRQGMNASTIDAFRRFDDDLNQTVGKTLSLVWERTAANEETKLVKRIGLRGRFDMVRPEAIEAALQRSSFLIREISAETRSAIQQTIARSIRDGIAPRKAAQEIRQLIGLTSRQAGAVQNYRQTLRAAGASVQTANRAAADYARRSLNQRALTIARTETIRSSVDGQLAAWTGARDNGLISEQARKEWLTADDERRCPTCEGLQGASVLLDESFDGMSGPPAHPRCRCTLVLTYPTRRRS